MDKVYVTLCYGRTCEVCIDHLLWCNRSDTETQVNRNMQGSSDERTPLLETGEGADDVTVATETVPNERYHTHLTPPHPHPVHHQSMPSDLMEVNHISWII